MKISRWIYVPLFIALWYVLFTYLFDTNYGSVYWLIVGTLSGFFLLYMSDRKAKQISKNSDDDRIFDVRQQRTLILLTDYEKTFELCRQAILSLKFGVIKREDLQNGIIKAQRGVDWSSWGDKIDLNLKEVNKNLTEVELFIRPVLRTTIVSSGENWKLAEDISKYLKDKDAEINQKVLVESAAILDNIYVKPFQKEKVER